jgi:cell shape-determining protein MreC
MAFTFSQHRGRFVLVGLILAHLAIISRQVDGGGGQSLFTRLVLTAVSPIQLSVAAVGRGFHGLWVGYVDLRGARSTAKEMEDRVRKLEIRLLECEQLASESERLRGVFALRTSLRVESLVAEVIGRDGVPWARTLTNNNGSSESGSAPPS